MASNRSPLISPAELEAARASTLVFEVTWRGQLKGMHQDQADVDAFEQGHIPGALLMDVQRDLSLPKTDDTMFTSWTRQTDKTRLGETLSALGISGAAAPILLYSRAARPTPGTLAASGSTKALVASGMMGATRAWWTLRSWGFTNVRVLDGGYEAWKKIGVSPAVGAAKGGSSSFDVATLVDLGQMMKATQADVLAATNVSSSVQIMDTLPGWPNTAKNYGQTPARQGHIATAHNVPCADLVGEDGMFLGKDAIRAYFQRQGTDLGKPVIAY